MVSNIVLEQIPIVELLAGLAEECSELSHAALKLRRAYDGTNPTPLEPSMLHEKLMEEIGDVELYLDHLGIDRMSIYDYKISKLQRWENRLQKKYGQDRGGAKDGSFSNDKPGTVHGTGTKPEGCKAVPDSDGNG